MRNRALLPGSVNVFNGRVPENPTHSIQVQQNLAFGGHANS